MELDQEELMKTLPPEAGPALMKAGYFEPDRLDLGMRISRLALTSLAGDRMVEIGGEGKTRPTVLIFGSYT